MHPEAVKMARGSASAVSIKCGVPAPLPPPVAARDRWAHSLPLREADPSPLLSPAALAVHSCDSNLLEERQILLTSGSGRPGSAAAAPGAGWEGGPCLWHQAEPTPEVPGSEVTLVSATEGPPKSLQVSALLSDQHGWLKPNPLPGSMARTIPWPTLPASFSFLKKL